jgi:hypothetical protein
MQHTAVAVWLPPVHIIDHTAASCFITVRWVINSVATASGPPAPPTITDCPSSIPPPPAAAATASMEEALPRRTFGGVFGLSCRGLSLPLPLRPLPTAVLVAVGAAAAAWTCGGVW